jgi:hypothetical protein
MGQIVAAKAVTITIKTALFWDRPMSPGVRGGMVMATWSANIDTAAINRSHKQEG